MEAGSGISAVMSEKMEPCTTNVLSPSVERGEGEGAGVRNDPRLPQTEAAKL